MMKRILASIAVGVMPLVALAQVGVNTTYNGQTGVGGLMKWFSGILSLAVPLIISLAVVWFIWNVFQFAVAGNEEDKAKAKTQMIWGLVGIFVMVSVWGLIGILSSTFNLGTGMSSGPTVPILQ